MQTTPTFKRLYPLARSVVLVLLASLVVFGLSGGVLGRLELIASDLLFRLRGPTRGESQVVIVAIDDASFATNELQWPWPRDYIAQIVDGVAAGNPSVIVLDIFFYEESDPEADEALALSMAEAENVVLVNDISSQTQAGLTLRQLNQPIPALDMAAAATGLANFPRDADGTVRRLLAFQEYNEQLYFSWALHAARLHLGEEVFTVGSSEEVLIGVWPVELDQQYLAVNYSGPPGSIPTYSAYQVADGLVDPAVFNGKIVVIGATSESLHDSYPTPYSSQPPTPGVEVTAHAINTVLSRRYIHSAGVVVQSAVIAAMALAGVTLARSLRALTGTIVATVVAAAYGVACLAVFTQARVILPIAGPMIALALTYAAQTSIELYEERRKGARVRAILTQIEREKRRSDKLLHVIIPMGVALSEAKDFDRLAEMILLEAKNLCNADGATLYLRTSDDQLRFLIMTNDSLGLMLGGTTGKEIPYGPLPLQDETGTPNTRHVAAYTALEGITVNIPDAYHAADHDFSGTRAFDEEIGYRTTSLLCIPLKDVENEVIGVMQLINARDPDTDQVMPFDQDMQQLVESLSWMETVALEAHVREAKLKRQIEELRIEVDEARRASEVAAITETEYFQQLQEQARDLRSRRRRQK